MAPEDAGKFILIYYFHEYLMVWISMVVIKYLPAVFRIQDPGSDAFLTPGSGMGKKSGSGIRIWDEQPRSYFLELRNSLWAKILKFFDADPGWKKFGPGKEKSRIRDKHPGSATLPTGTQLLPWSACPSSVEKRQRWAA
jgi:hypothetical protein